MASEPVKVVDIDLTSLSRATGWASATPYLVPVVILLWCGLLLLLAVVAMPLAVLLGVGTILLIVFGLFTMVRQRTVSSTTGTKSELIAAEHATQRLPDFDRTVGEIVDAVDAFRRDPDRREAGAADAASAAPAAAPSKRTAAIVYIVLGVLIIALGIPGLLIARITGVIPLFLVLGAGFALFTRARRLMQPTAELARANDPRPPILFLRSFQDDKVKAKVLVRVAGLPSYQKFRFEEALGLRMRDFGPFLAVGEPGEGLPKLGAARAYLADDQWQDAVVNWIRESRLIVLLCGPTHWISWEMQNIIKHRRINHVLLLLPPGRSSWSDARRTERWANIVHSLEDTPYAAALRSLDITDVLLVQFAPSGVVRVFRSANELVQDYELALTLAIHAVLTDPALAGAAPAADAASADPAWTPVVSHATGGSEAGTRAAPRPPALLWAKLALFGAIGGIAGGALSAAVGTSFDRTILVSLRSAILALAVTAGAWLFYNRDKAFLGWLFVCVAAAYAAGAVGASSISGWIPRDLWRLGVISLPPIINSLLIALLMFWALSVRFRNFRLAGVWILALGAALLMGALAPIGFSIRDGQILAAIRFTVVPWAVLAGCIGFGLSSRPDPLR
jgi:hypothetical protein